jgi:hypothetical protein
MHQFHDLPINPSRDNSHVLPDLLSFQWSPLGEKNLSFLATEFG